MVGEAVDSIPTTPLWKRVLAWVGAAVALVLLAFTAMHMMIRPVSPDQETPAGHFGRPCVACHIVSEGTDVVDVGN